MKDNIYSPEGVKGQEPLAEQKGSFKFDQSVVEVFDDMIKRSVPGYEDIADLQSRLLAKYLHKGDRVYDLGCSIGHSLYTLKKYFSENLEVIGVDTSEPMLEKFKSNTQPKASGKNN